MAFGILKPWTVVCSLSALAGIVAGARVAAVAAIGGGATDPAIAIFAAVVVGVVQATAPGRAYDVPVDGSAPQSPLSLNERLWYLDWSAVGARTSLARPACPESPPGAVTYVVPGTRLTFRVSGRYGVSTAPSAGPTPKPWLFDGRNPHPWALASYQWIIPGDTFTRDDAFVMQYLLDVGHVVYGTTDAGIDESADPAHPVYNLLQRYSLVADALGATTGSSIDFEQALARHVFDAGRRCLQIARSVPGATPVPLPTAVAAATTPTPVPCPIRPPRRRETTLASVASGAPAADLITLLERGSHADFADNQDDPETRSGTSLRVTMHLPDTVANVQDYVSNPQDKRYAYTLVTANWSNFFFSEPLWLRSNVYTRNSAYAPKVNDAHGYVTADIPVTVGGELVPRFVPITSTVRAFELRNGVEVRGIRRACEFFASYGDCEKDECEASSDEHELISRVDRRVTLSFVPLTARKLTGLADGHPNAYVLLRADEQDPTKDDKRRILLAPFDHLYVIQKPFSHHDVPTAPHPPTPPPVAAAGA